MSEQIQKDLKHVEIRRKKKDSRLNTKTGIIKSFERDSLYSHYDNIKNTYVQNKCILVLEQYIKKYDSNDTVAQDIKIPLTDLHSWREYNMSNEKHIRSIIRSEQEG